MLTLARLMPFPAIVANPGSVETSPVEFNEHYLMPELSSKNEDTPNLVYIYLEGLEHTYFDEARFPGLIKGLRTLEDESVTFTDIRQFYGTRTTMGGMVASQCGIPLVTPSLPNSMSGMDLFLSGATCIGDVLNAKGYHLAYMGGASLDFAGKGKFYKSHGFKEVRGRKALLSLLDDPYYRTWWGLFDDSLFELAYQRFESLAESEHPFGLFLLTLDTHHPVGHPSRSCEGREYRNGDNPILNAVACSDYLVSRFVERIRRSEHARNTVIVIASDHLAMRNTAWNVLNQGPRRNLFIVLDPRREPPRRVDKPGSTMDVAPTILSLLGYPAPAFGLGRDLLRDPPTLVEELSHTSRVLAGWAPRLARFWDYPVITEGVLIDAIRARVRIADRVFKTPVLISLGPDLSVEEIKFEFYGPKALISYVLEEEYDHPLVWVDRCTSLQALAPNLPKSGLCVFAGKLGSKSVISRVVYDETFLSHKELAGLVSAQASTPVFNERVRRIEAVARHYTKPQQYEVSLYTSGTGWATIRANGGVFRGRSFLRFLTGAGERFRFLRGISLVGITADGRAKRLSRVDPCSDPKQIDNAWPFVRLIAKHSPEFPTFTIVVHYSAICASEDLDRLFQGLSLEKWKRLGWRKPYIAVIASQNGASYEVIGDSEGGIELQLWNFAPKVMLDGADADVGVHRLHRVAHAGGAYNRQASTNSLEALNNNADRYRLFEVDLSWSADKQLICIHDWRSSYERAFGFKAKAVPTLARFEQLVRERAKYRNCTLESLVNWLSQHPSALLVTDVKKEGSNIRALAMIANRFPDYAQRVISQIYNPDNYAVVRGMGYQRIIWTLYRYRGDDKSVLGRAREMDL